MRASELFASSQGAVCLGNERCHWCGAVCDRTWMHDDELPIPFEKPKHRAKLPGEPWVCIGCWLWRRPRVTVRYIDGSYKDVQSARDHSWIITEEGAWALKHRPSYNGDLWKMILKPPLRFVLSFKDGDIPNHLHLAIANDFTHILADTPIRFTVNGTEFSCSVYDLEEAHKHKVEEGPGVRELIRLLGPCPYLRPEPPPQKQEGAGRPPALPTPLDTVKKEIRPEVKKTKVS